MDFISRNLQKELSLDEIAAQAYFSKYHFHRIFKACTGETVSAYIRRLRLEKAANRLLSDSGETITTIAMDCGFTSSQNFATVFKKQFGMSPKIFQDNYNSDLWAAPAPDIIKSEKARENTVFAQRSRLWIDLMKMPEFNVAYKRIIGPYDFVKANQAFDKMFTRLAPLCDIHTSISLGVVWDNPEVTAPENCRYDACITVPDSVPDSIETQTIPEGEYVVSHCEISSYAALESVYGQIFSGWFPQNNYVPADSISYEIYLNNPANHPRGSLLIDICIPVEEI
ncbi:MAG: AraC family transcriptional regulator [Desulfobacterales bacterium]|nr:AraC family transcriptional regulator [Desulfobacterales bacterium]